MLHQYAREVSVNEVKGWSRRQGDWLTDWPLLFISISTALTGVGWAGFEILRLVGQMGLMNHWTRTVVVSSLNVIGSRCTDHNALQSNDSLGLSILMDRKHKHATVEGRITIIAGSTTCSREFFLNSVWNGPRERNIKVMLTGLVGMYLSSPCPRNAFICLYVCLSVCLSWNLSSLNTFERHFKPVADLGFWKERMA